MAELRVSPGGKRDTPPQPLTELDLILAAVRELHAFEPALARGLGVSAEHALKNYNTKRPTPLYEGMVNAWVIAPGTRL